MPADKIVIEKCVQCRKRYITTEFRKNCLGSIVCSPACTDAYIVEFYRLKNATELITPPGMSLDTPAS